MLEPSFIPDNKFGRVHHRFLNNRERTLALSKHMDRNSDFVEIAEGDLCWYKDNGEYSFLMIHPKIFNQIPSLQEARKEVVSGNIPDLIELVSEDLAGLKFIIELKTGYGDTGEALEQLIGKLEERIPGRYIFDAFSPKLLSLVKEINEDVPTSLHLRAGVYDSRAIVTSYQFPWLGLRKISNLSQVDVLTITYKYSIANYGKSFGFSIDDICQPVLEQGKDIFFGGVECQKTFDFLRSSCARAAYRKFDKKRFAEPYKEHT